MNKKTAEKALKKLRENAKTRKFNQSVDFILTLKNFDPKKVKVDTFIDLHYDRGKKIKICAIVGPELKETASKFCDLVITKENFAAYKDKKVMKQLANSYDYFIAQGDVMKDVATVFGRVLGSRGKMPNPKGGCVIPPNANVEAVVSALQKRIHIKTGTSAQIMCSIGKQDQDDAVLSDNLLTIFNAILSQLPAQQNNVWGSFIKFTMGQAVRVED